MELEPRHRNALVMGALVGAMLGAGTVWLMSQTVERDPTQPKKPIRPDEIIRFVARVAGLVRDLDDMRRRL